MITHLHDLITRGDLERAVADGLVKSRPHPDGGLTIWNYTAAAMWTPGSWDNPAVRACRGLITTDDGVVIARPWDKFFNHGQPEAGDLALDAPVEVTDKMDGSLGILYQHPVKGWAVATRGSFTSEQAATASRLLGDRDFDPSAAVEWTALVEIIYPANRIVCDYGDREELVLLGAVNVDTGECLGPDSAAGVLEWDGESAPQFPYSTLREALAAPPRPGAEGLVVRFTSERQRLVKIKQADYVELHRIVTGLSERSVWRHMVYEGTLETLLEPLPDELHEWTRRVWFGLANAVEDVMTDALHWHGILTSAVVEDTRKAYAQAVASDVPPALRPYMFHLFDERNPRPSILARLKPAGDVRAKTITEDIA